MSIAQRFKDIADAIREKTGGVDPITPLQMPGAIRGIQTGLETMTEAAWEELSTAEKQALGVVGIIQANSGYNRGIIVNGEDYIPVPILTYSGFMSAVSYNTLTYTFNNDSKYLIYVGQILGSRQPTISDLTITLNNENINSLFTQKVTGTINGNIVNMSTLENSFSINDTITVNIANAISNSGIQLFIIEHGKEDAFELIGIRYNGGGTFPIPASSRYLLQVSKYGYYAGNNVIPGVEIAQYPSGGTSIECPSGSSSTYWMGGTYAVYIQ